MQLIKQLNYISPAGREIPVTLADSFKSRFFGLMGRREGIYGLLLSPCNSIHTCFMRYSLDAVFLDRDNKVIAIKRCLKPFSVVSPVQGAKKVLEFPSSLQALAFLSQGAIIKLN